MNIKQLEIFVAIADTGSFSKGADALFITQSTASQHVASLEELSGVRLLDRTGRGALPTEAGKILLGHAHIATTAIYTHLTTPTLTSLQGLLDRLMAGL